LKKTWPAIGVALALAVFAVLAFALLEPPSDNGVTSYMIATENLKSTYAGPTKFIVSAQKDPATKLERIPGGFVIHGVMESDSPEVLKVSSNGRVRFTTRVMGPRRQYWVFGANTYTMSSSDTVLEPAP
jgi:hypothetical protein